MRDAGSLNGGQWEPRASPEERREVAEYALLGLLREGPRHGYLLAAAFGPEGRLGIALRLKMSQMYAYLRKLERQGLLLARDETDAELAPRPASLRADGGGRARLRRLAGRASGGDTRGATRLPAEAVLHAG